MTCLMRSIRKSLSVACHKTSVSRDQCLPEWLGSQVYTPRKYSTRTKQSADRKHKKCNLTLAMSPTCHSNNTITICWMNFSESVVSEIWIIIYHFWSSPDRQTTDRQKAIHMSPPCNLHRQAQKMTRLKCLDASVYFLLGDTVFTVL